MVIRVWFKWFLVFVHEGLVDFYHWVLCECCGLFVLVEGQGFEFL